MTESTFTDHARDVLGTAVSLFVAFGGLAAAVIGDYEAWSHLNWIPSTFITVALASLVVAAGIHITEEP